jgi:beta-lactamase regulating signal transducer with metallopeptidase domain
MSSLPPDLAPAAELALRNLVAWTLQVGLVAWAAAVLARVLPLEGPTARLRLWQGVLAAALVLPVLQPWHVSLAGVDWTLGLGGAASVAPGPSTTVGHGSVAPSWALGVAAVLLGGVAWQLARLGLGLARLGSLWRRAAPLDVPDWLTRLGAQHAPRARFLVGGSGTPATFGVVRPVILLPREFTGMPLDRQRAVALHELIHARRHDWLALVGEELVRSVFFFHPAVHWLIGRIRLAREQCVDFEVVRRMGGRRAYLESLVEVARLSARAAAVPAAPFLHERHLRERVELLLKEVSMSRVRTLAHLGATTGALALALSAAVVAFPMVAAPSGSAAGDPREPAPVAAPGEESKPFPAKKVHHVNPVYPEGAREDGAQGIFIIAVTIDAGGRVAAAEVVVSAPSNENGENLMDRKGTPEALRGAERLAKAAVDAVRQWRYEPVLDEAGNPIKVEAVLTVRFRLS